MKKSCTLCAFLLMVIFSYSQNCVPKISLRDAVTDKTEVVVDCSNKLDEKECLKLNIKHDDLKSTSTYLLSNIPYTPVASFNSGTKLPINSEDRFSDVINLPFKFCFYENTFERLVVGNNGIVSFDTSLANQSCPWNIVANLPDSNLVRNAIFGVFHDMSNGFSLTCQDDPNTPENECGEIYTSVIGTAPCRMFVINFYNMSHFNCKTEKTSSQIVLYESTNAIEIYIQSKPLSCDRAKEKRALVGIQNHIGNQGMAPLGRNTDSWAATNEAWRFTPNGVSSVNYVWKNKAGSVVSTEKDPTFCNLEGSTTFTLEATFNVCNGMKITTSQPFDIIFSKDYPLTKSVDHEMCDIGQDGTESFLLNELEDKILNKRAGFSLSYYGSQEDAKNKTNPITTPVVVTPTTKTYYYRLEKTPTCFHTQLIRVKLSANPENRLNTEKVLCDTKNDKIETLNLADFIPEIVGTQRDVTVTFHTTYEQAKNGILPITTYTLTSNTSLYVQLSRNGECSVVSEIKFVLSPSPKSAEITGANLCYDPNVGKSVPHNFTVYETQFPDYTNQLFSYHMSESEAFENRNPLNPRNINVNVSPFVVYVRIRNKDNNCLSVGKITVTLREAVKTKDAKYSMCDFDQDESEPFNLNDAIPEMITNPAEVNYSFFKTYDGAIKQDKTVQIESDKINKFLIRDKMNIYVRFQEKSTDCYSISKIVFKLEAKPRPVYTQIAVCVEDENEKYIIDLYPYGNILSGGDKELKVSWHKTKEAAMANTNYISTYETTNNSTVWIRMARNEVCWNVEPINIKFLKKEEAILEAPYKIYFCDNMNDKYEEVNLYAFLPNLFEPGTDRVVTFYRKYEKGVFSLPITNPTTYNVFSGGSAIYANGQANSCSKAIRIVNLIQNESIELNELRKEICDKDNSGDETIKITDFLGFMNSTILKYKFGIFKSRDAAINNDMDLSIKNILSFNLVEGENTVWVRIENDKGCINVKPIVFNLKKYPKQINLMKICDNQNDGKEENFDLRNLNIQLANEIPDLSFTYYKTLSDAQNNVNEITVYDIATTTKLYAKVSNGECSVINELSFQFISSSSVTGFVQDKICDNNWDGIESVDLTTYQIKMVPDEISNYVFVYFRTEEEAKKNINPIPNARAHQITEDDHTVYVRILNNFSCYSISKLSVELDRKILAKDATQKFICDVYANTSGYADLESYIPSMISDVTDLQIDFYKNYEDAVRNILSKKIKDTKNYHLDAISNVIFVRFYNPILGCFSIKKIPINLQLPPKLVDGDYYICDTDLNGMLDVNLEELNNLLIANAKEYTFTYYLNENDARTKTNPIKNTQKYDVPSTPFKVYINVDNSVCTEVSEVTLLPNEVTVLKKKEINYTECEEENKKFTLDLTQFNTDFLASKGEFSYYLTENEANQSKNALTNPTSFLVGTQTIYVRINETGKCPVIGKIHVTVKLKPVLPMPKELSFCVNESIEVEVGLDLPKENYVWDHGKIGKIIRETKPGTYTVHVTGENGCVKTQSIRLIGIELPVITQLIATESSIRVIANDGNDPLFEYSIDGGKNWQSSSLFEHLPAGKYTFIVRSLKTGCISNPRSTIIIDVKNLVTPNGDSKNDTWVLDDLNVFEGNEASLTIFDRYGKIIHSDKSATKFVWKGDNEGRALASTSYWYKINLPDGREFTGYIVVKNRN